MKQKLENNTWVSVFVGNYKIYIAKTRKKGLKANKLRRKLNIIYYII